MKQVEGFKMNLIYYDLYQATRLEKFVSGMYHQMICLLLSLSFNTVL